MNYTLDSGKTIKIPDKEIEQLKLHYNLSDNDATIMWLVDEGYLEDETVEELSEKAKKNRITATVHQAKALNSDKKERKPREKKENPLKKQIISAIFSGLQAKMPANAQISIANDEKYINIRIDELDFTVNLVQHRAKKGDA